MLGLDTELIMHHLSIALDVNPVKKKLRKMHHHVALLVKVELENLLKANFIRAIDYVEWISIIVPISKHEKSVQVCTDFRDLNKAFQKDEFPLPNIDMIVDMKVGYDMYSLMDGFSSCNQIKIAPKDQEKMAKMCMGNLLLEHHAIWPQKCWCYISKGYDHYIP